MLPGLLAPELSFRSLLHPFLRFEVRALYEFNFLFHQQNLRLSSTLDVFLATETSHSRSLYFKYEVLLPTNYARHQINELWHYLGYRWGLGSGQNLACSLAFVQWIWTESSDFKREFPNLNYRVNDRAFLVTLHYIHGFQL